MSYNVPEVGHFDGGANLNQGQRHNNDEILSEMFRKKRTVKVVAAGAGDEAVAFSEAFEDTDYTVSYMFEDSAGGATLGTAYIKQGTIAVGGFTATVSAAGTYHFTAEHD